MRAAPGPDVVLTKEPGRIKQQENIRHFLVAVILIFAGGGLLFSWINWSPQISEKFSELSSSLRINQLVSSIYSLFGPGAKILRSGKTAYLSKADYIPIFQADLEYDPKTGVTRQIRAEAARGDYTRLLANQPKASANKFIYQVEVASGPKEIIHSGWIAEYKDVIQKEDGKLSFRVIVPYRPNSVIKVYLSDKTLIWTGQTNKKETI